MLTLDSSLATTTSNSYVDLAYANDYWTGHFSATKAAQWAALSDQQKTTLLIQATRILETARYTHFVPISEYQLHYDRITGQVLDISMNRAPVRYYYYQKLQFPRNLDIDPITQELYIQPGVQMAQCEQAIYLLNFDESAIATRLQGIVSDALSIGRGQVHTQQQFVAEGSSFAPMALEMIRPFFVKSVKQRRA